MSVFFLSLPAFRCTRRPLHFEHRQGRGGVGVHRCATLLSHGRLLAWTFYTRHLMQNALYSKVRQKNSGTRQCNPDASFLNVLTMTGESYVETRVQSYAFLENRSFGNWPKRWGKHERGGNTASAPQRRPVAVALGPNVHIRRVGPGVPRHAQRLHRREQPRGAGRACVRFLRLSSCSYASSSKTRVP